MKLKDLKKWEKIFIILSIIFIVIVFLVYGYRLIYFYKLEHSIMDDNTLASHIIQSGTVMSGDGLYTIDESKYFFKGKNVNNYLWYSGRMFRIMNITDEGIKLITDNVMSSLVYLDDVKYEDSYLNIWMNNIEEIEYSGIFINSIKDTSELVKFNTCVDVVNLNDITCNNVYSNYVGLLSLEDYLESGGSEGYINKGSYFWTSNKSLENLPYYIFGTGGINSQEGNYSYGVRPVIMLKRYISYVSGNGSLNNPYRVSDLTSENITDAAIGDYVKYNDYLFRIQNVTDDNYKLILDGYLDKKLSYKSDIIKNLNDNFYKEFSSDYLVKCDYFNGEYGKNNNYSYLDVFKSKKNSYVGIPSIGELFINDYDDYWLYNDYSQEDTLNYKVSSKGLIIGDLVSNTNNVRPVICVNNSMKFVSGDGTKTNPYEVGD